MNRNHLVILTVLLLAFMLGSCKKEITKNIDQDKIWTSFQLNYDENEDKTTAIAEFRFSTSTGTLLEMSDPSTVMFDGTEMEWKSDLAYYQLEFSGLVPSGNFSWVDLDGNMFNNSVDIRDIAYPSMMGNLHYGDSITYFMWEGLPLDSFETVILEIDGSGPTDTKRFLIDSLNATTITIDSLTLSLIMTDTTSGSLVDLRLVKKYSPPMQEETSKGGERVGRYQPTNKQVILTD